MARRWQEGERPRTEEFLERHPELREQPEAAIQLICEEICLREDHGEAIAPSEMYRRFPQWRPQLEVVLDCHRLFRPAPPPRFPSVGETFADFPLVAELGRGGQGRVFLAVQPALADRPVVLKVTPCDGHEHLSLARLQHTHIVPLFSAQEEPIRNLRVLCMPYFGGTSLDQLLDALRTKPPAERSGRDLLEALDRRQASLPIAQPSKGPVRELLTVADYVETLCWIGMRLADALEYAHERGLVHLDLKPSNVLLAADAQPMLLDFHLARAPLRPDEAEPEWLGGTPDYMSPEQRDAVEAVRDNLPLHRAVDARSDIYSLGLLLFEALAGRLPESGGNVADQLRQLNPAVSVGLADVLARCLERDPARRYARAADLAVDLRNHLGNKPLQGVRNRSLGEALRKWRKRKPYVLRRCAMAALLVAVCGIVGAMLWQRHDDRLRQAHAALADGQEKIRTSDFAGATRLLRQGRDLAHGLPGSNALVRSFDECLEEAHVGQLTQDLHAVAEQVRFLFGVEALSEPRARALESACRRVWEAHGQVWQHAGPGPEARESLRTDLLDLVVLWTELRVQLASPADVQRRRQEALQVLDEAEECLGTSAILCRERRIHAEALGLTDIAAAAAACAARTAPRTAWDHYAIGRALLSHGDPAGANAAFDKAIVLAPQDFWANYYQGCCAYRLKKHADAVAAFRVCIALAPGKAECYCNRALALQALAQPESALADYDRALRLDPSLPAALLNRGLLQYQARRYRAATADLQKALASGADPAAVHYNLALVYMAQNDRNRARDSVQRALDHRADFKEARDLQERLQ
jgi:serine/threonine protein kinase/tetratricopeptide (TPR) repeat protein